MSENDSQAITRLICPVFSGKHEDFDTWKLQVEDWADLTGSTVPGIEIRFSLRGKALEVTKDISREELKSGNGKNIIMEALSKVFGRDKLMDKYFKVKSYLNLKRREEESIYDFIHRYEMTTNECNKVTGNDTGEIKAFHILECANITEKEKQLVLSACGTENLQYNKMVTALTRIIPSKNTVDKKEEWMEGRTIHYENKNYNYPRFRKKNPIGKDGKISRCYSCGSEYHWSRHCTKNKRTNYTDTRNTGKKEEIYLQEDSGIEGILDTGCSTTVCGEL